MAMLSKSTVEVKTPVISFISAQILTLNEELSLLWEIQEPVFVSDKFIPIFFLERHTHGYEVGGAPQKTTKKRKKKSGGSYSQSGETTERSGQKKQ